MRSHSAFALAAVAVTVLASAAEAAPPRRDGYGYGFVVAHSRYGNGSVTGPVRQGRFGLEVQLPGGTWMHCRRSCSETLREETIDFWKTREERGIGPYRR